MTVVAQVLVAIVALLHLGFLVLEMVLWPRFYCILSYTFSFP